MDDLTLLKGFRAERAADDAEARAEIRLLLQGRFDAACATSAPVASSDRPRGRTAGRLRLLRRRALAFGGAVTVAIAAAGVLVLSSGPTAQKAAAEILRETAEIAVSPNAPTSSPQPGPGQFLYTKVKRVELQSWIAGCGPLEGRPCVSLGGTMSGPDAFNALMPTMQEEWLGEGGAWRSRWVAGTPRFWSEEERSRWEAAGSPLPAPFDPEYQRKLARYQRGDSLSGHSVKSRAERRGVFDTETVVNPDHSKGQPFRFPDTSRLPTDPKALRRAVESNRIPVSGFNLLEPSAKHLDAEATTNQLFEILGEGNPMTPQLRAAVFNALAELPGIQVNTDATDPLGRSGYAIRSLEKGTGNGLEFIFDPDTAELLAKRTFLGKSDHSPYLKGVPAGSTISETAYLETAIVDSTHETGGKAEGRGPVAHISTDRKQGEHAR